MPDTQPQPNTAPDARAIRCRAIAAEDLDAVGQLLARGFPERSLDYWRQGLEVLRDRPAIADTPRYGFMIEDGGQVHGVLLTLYVPGRPNGAQRCHLSSLYVDPDYRHLALHLDRASTRDKTTTYVNISPAEHTRKFIAALGYVSLNEDTVLALPWLSAPRPGVRVAAYTPADDARLTAGEARLAADHLALGCHVLVAADGAGASVFVFQNKPLPGVKKGAVHVIYTPSMERLVHLTGPLGRALLPRGIAAWKLDAAAVPRGLVGRAFTGRSARWAKGPNPPGPNDLSYSELVIFGP